MAGIGVNLNRIYSKKTITTNLIGFGYSAAVTIAPMFFVIGTVLFMGAIHGLPKVNYVVRELYSCTILYMFIFSLLSSSPFNAVLSKYMSDIIYEEKYQDILPCYFVGLVLNTLVSCVIGVPFLVWEYSTGKVAIEYICAGACGYISLVFVFYSMLYLSVCKDYKKITLFYFLGMGMAILVSFILIRVFRFEITFGMLVALDVGFLFLACLEWAQVKSYFRTSSNNYKKVLLYFKDYWQLVVTNFLYNLGMFVHNFVFWGAKDRMVVADCFVSFPNYDMATCLAMFTNVSAMLIFVSRIEMNFHQRYKRYSEAVIGGRWMDISSSKRRMFHQLSTELMNLVCVQFVVSIVLFLVCSVFLSRMGFGGQVMQIYPCLTAGYFIMYIMYAIMIFLYYYNDMQGAVCTTTGFVIGTIAGSCVSVSLSPLWYGMGLVFGAFVGFSVGYYYIRKMEKQLDVHIFCNGNIMQKGAGAMPSNKVFDRYAMVENQKRKGRKG